MLNITNLLKLKPLEEIEKLLADNAKVSSEACKAIKRSNGQLPKAILGNQK